MVALSRVAPQEASQHISHSSATTTATYNACTRRAIKSRCRDDSCHRHPPRPLPPRRHLHPVLTRHRHLHPALTRHRLLLADLEQDLSARPYRKVKGALALLMILALSAGANESALARGHGGGRSGGHSSGHSHHSHVRIGVIAGGPVFWGGYYYGAPYYYPQGVAVPYSPLGYIERGNDAYYCGETASYYPDVVECQGGWLLLTPQPGPPS